MSPNSCQERQPTTALLTISVCTHHVWHTSDPAPVWQPCIEFSAGSLRSRVQVCVPSSLRISAIAAYPHALHESDVASCPTSRAVRCPVCGRAVPSAAAQSTCTALRLPLRAGGSAQAAPDRAKMPAGPALCGDQASPRSCRLCRGVTWVVAVTARAPESQAWQGRRGAQTCAPPSDAAPSAPAQVDETPGRHPEAGPRPWPARPAQAAFASCLRKQLLLRAPGRRHARPSPVTAGRGPARSSLCLPRGPRLFSLSDSSPCYCWHPTPRRAPRHAPCTDNSLSHVNMAAAVN
jgi:hypothetical protein